MSLMAFNIIFTAFAFALLCFGSGSGSAFGTGPKQKGITENCVHFMPSCCQRPVARSTPVPPGNARKLLQQRLNIVQIPSSTSSPTFFLFWPARAVSCRASGFFCLCCWLFIPHCLLFGAATVNSQLNYAISYVRWMLHYFACTFSPSYTCATLYLLATCFTFLLSSPPFGTLCGQPFRPHIAATYNRLPRTCPMGHSLLCCLACQWRCLAYCTCLASVE